MELDRNFMTAVLTVYDELIDNGISIVYIGKFNQQIVTFFPALLEEQMAENSEDKKIKKRVFHTLVEILQNLQRHSDEITQFNVKKSSGVFMIGKKDSIYYIITSNKIETQTIPSLTSALETVNNATIKELREMYKTQLRDGSLSKKGGAGLGLIDIARKTEEKIDYLFIPINNNLNYFVLKAEIDTEKMKLSRKERYKD